ncbi:MAG: hypothetical protein KDA72_18815 [Planctomycetales bacterium]|nr:hypothetical protein [Planctomycetales bacterium]
MEEMPNVFAIDYSIGWHLGSGKSGKRWHDIHGRGNEIANSSRWHFARCPEDRGDARATLERRRLAAPERSG